MLSELKDTLIGFKNIKIEVCRAITHTHIRVIGDSVKISRAGFIADIFMNRRTQIASIARIDTRDESTLRKICTVISHFQF